MLLTTVFDLVVQVTVAFLLKISSKSIQIFAWELFGCQKKQKCSRNSNLLSNCAVFQPNLNKAQKTSQNDQKPWEKDCFLTDFLSLLDFGSKTAQFDKTCQFLELFCFFWHPKHFQARICIEDMTDFTFHIGIFCMFCHLVFFEIIFKIKVDFAFIVLSHFKRNTSTIIKWK